MRRNAKSADDFGASNLLAHVHMETCALRLVVRQRVYRRAYLASTQFARELAK